MQLAILDSCQIKKNTCNGLFLDLLDKNILSLFIKSYKVINADSGMNQR